MLPSVAAMKSVTRQILLYTVALVTLSWLLVPVAHFGPLYASLAAILGILFVRRALALRRNPSPEQAMKLFSYSITYLAALFLSMGIDALVRHP